MKKCQLETTFFFADVNDKTVQQTLRALKSKPAWPISSRPTRASPPPKSQTAFRQFLDKVRHAPNPAGEYEGRPHTPAAGREPRSELNPRLANTKDNQMIKLNVADIQGFVLRGYNFPFARYLLFELPDPQPGAISSVS